METTHENSRFRSQLLGKTRVLNSALLARLKLQFLPSATVKNLTKPNIKRELLEKTSVLSINKLTKVNLKKSFQKLGVISFTSLLASCQPSYAIASTNQNLNNHSFNYVELVAVTGNNARQELRKLLTTVQYHHTLVDVFLCLSFANCLFTGELRLALALVCLWWGGDGNKPFIRQIPSAVLLRFSSLPTALTLGQSSKHLYP